MGLGGVAIAALPSMIHPKLSFSDSLGGDLSRYNRLFVFFDVCQSKARSGYGVIPVSKAMVWQQKAMV